MGPPWWMVDGGWWPKIQKFVFVEDDDFFESLIPKKISFFREPGLLRSTVRRVRRHVLSTVLEYNLETG